MAADGKSSGASSADSDNVKQIQETAKWIVASIGAVAIVLVAGLSFSDLGALDFDHAFSAITGTFFALFGLFWLFTDTIRVLVTRPVSLSDLSNLKTHESVGLDNNLVSPAASVQDLSTGVNAKIQDAEDAYEAYLANPTDDKTRLAYQRANQAKEWWESAARRTLERVRLNRSRAAFDQVNNRLWLKVLLLFGGVCIAAYSLTAPRPDQKSVTIGVVTTTPTTVLVEFIDRGIEEFEDLLGSECVAAGQAHSATAIAVEGDELTVVLTPSELCPAAEVITVSPGTAKVGLPPKS